jgi:hypothetical protein
MAIHATDPLPDCGSQVFYTEPTEPDLVATRPAARAWRASPPTPSITSEGRSRCGRAVATWARGDSDFDPIRDEPAFQDLLSRDNCNDELRRKLEAIEPQQLPRGRLAAPAAVKTPEGR